MFKLFLKFSYGSILSAAISLFTTPIVTALVSPEEFGKASMFILAYNLLLQFFLLGLDQSYVREFYREKSDQYQSALLLNTVYASLFFSIVGIGGILLFRNFISGQIAGYSSHKIIIVLILNLLVGVLERFSVLFLRMKQQATRYSLIKLVGSIVVFCVTFFYARYISGDFYSIVYANMASLLVSAVIALSLSKSYWKPVALNKKLVKVMLSYGIPFVPTFIATWLFEGIDKIMLRHYSSYDELGIFSASFKFVALLSILQLAFSAFWIPVSMELYEKNSKEAAQKFSGVFAMVSGILFTGSTSVIFCKDLIIKLFDEKYHQASSIMPFLLLIPVMYTLSEITVGGINYSKKTYWHLFISICVAVINVMLAYYLVPHFGAKGAAFSTGISYILFFILRTVISNRYFPLTLKKKKIIIPTFVFLIVAHLNTFYQLDFVYIINFISVLFMVLIFQKELRGAVSSLKLKIFVSK